MKPKLAGKVRIGGIVSRATHPGAKNGALSGGPQMVEVSRDGRRIYFTNSLYGAFDPQFYPDGIDGWMVKLDANPNGSIAFDPKFFVKWRSPHRPHHVRLEDGDCSSDSCRPGAVVVLNGLDPWGGAHALAGTDADVLTCSICRQ
jgi:methanethiol oxidase